MSVKAIKEETTSVIAQDSIEGFASTKPKEDLSKNDSKNNKGVTKDCATSGGKANDIGLKTWCWEDLEVPSGAATGRDSFSNGQLALNIECSANQVVQEGDRLKFLLNPTSPAPASWCSREYNMRSEIRTMPWQVSHPSGTEEWIGWEYRWDDYTIDTTADYVFYQSHSGVVGTEPLLSLQSRVDVYGRPAGNIWLLNSSQKERWGTNNYTHNDVGIVAREGTSIRFVLHIVWGAEGVGRYQLWANDKLVVNVEEATVRPSNPVGGNSKFGIYYSPWSRESSVNKSAATGVTKIETSMGPLKIITRRPGNPEYGKNSFDEVTPPK